MTTSKPLPNPSPSAQNNQNTSTETMRDLNNSLKHDSLWAFALKLYQQPGFSDLCIEWQDAHQINVCVLLTLCWVDANQLTASPAQIEKAAADWSRDVVEPLRRLRRTLKQSLYFETTEEQQEAFRGAVKTLEIQSEKYLLVALEQFILNGHIDVMNGKKQNAAITYLVNHGVDSASIPQILDL